MCQPPALATASDGADTRRLAILGAGGHGRAVADTAEACGWRVDLYDDGWPRLQASGPWPVTGNSPALLDALATKGAYAGCLVAIGDGAARLQVHRCFAATDTPLPTLIHPAASVSRHAAIGPGSIIMAGAVVCVGARLGEACIVNTGATVDHDCALAAGVHISPGAHLAGGVCVGEGAWVGIGAAVKQGVRIGRSAVVGAGAVVLRDVEDGAVVVGCPARPLRLAEQEEEKGVVEVEQAGAGDGATKQQEKGPRHA